MQYQLKSYFRIPLSTRIFIWLLIGSVTGLLAKESILFIRPLGEIFVDLLIMAAVPLVFFNLLAGMTGIGSIRNLSKVGIMMIIFFVVALAVAMTIGISVMSLTNAGAGMDLRGPVPENIGLLPSLGETIMDMIPVNIFRSFAEGNIIQIVIFTILLGIVFLQLPENSKQRAQSGILLMTDMIRKLVDLILKASPVCLGALMAVTMAEYGSDFAGPLILFILSIYLAQALMVVFFMIILYAASGISPSWFLFRSLTLYATTIATCSSLASLSVSMDVAKQKLSLPTRIFSFVLPLGIQFNKGGTAIMLSGVMIFTAQAIGLEFSFAQLVQIVIIGILLSIGSGGVPGGGLVIAMIFAKAVNLPLEIVAVVGGIYRLIDMGITTVNCMGDLVAASVISNFHAGWNPKYKTDHQEVTSAPGNQPV